MGAAEVLNAMAARQELEHVASDVDKALKMLDDAERSLKAARSIAKEDPRSALLLAWDGVAFQALAAALLLAGYRVTSQPGHHRLAAVACRELLDDRALMFRIDAVRRMRSRGMYEGEAPEPAEADAALADAESLIQDVRTAAARSNKGR